MKTFPKITLIVPYYGTLPTFFKFWLKSCGYNESINWILVSDCIIENCPRNVKVLNISFKDLKVRIDTAVGFETNIDNPYKLCDFKPTYGHVFEEFLVDSDFWGYCDTDLIFGDIRSFLNNEILEKHDRILVNGHLSLFRNTKEISTWYKKFSDKKCDYKSIFRSSRNWAFDEFGGKTGTGGINRLCDENNVKQYKIILFDDIRQNQKSFFSLRLVEGRDSLEGVKFLPSYYEFNKGKLYRYVFDNNLWKKSGSLYVHFQKRIMIVNTDNLDEYIMIPNSFEDSKNVEDILKRCKYQYFYPHYIRIRFRNLKNKIKFLIKS